MARSGDRARQTQAQYARQGHPGQLDEERRHQGERIKDTDREIRDSFRLDERAEIIESLPDVNARGSSQETS